MLYLLRSPWCFTQPDCVGGFYVHVYIRYLYGYGLVYILYSHMFVWCESGLYSTVGEC